MKQTSEKKQASGPIVLIILDGFGEKDKKEGNAVKLARTPVLNELKKDYPNCLLSAFGKSVGLPDAQRGNSEAGHLCLGSGRIVEQDVVVISRCINL